MEASENSPRSWRSADHQGFIAGWSALEQAIHAWAKSKGFWPKEGEDRNDGEIIALMHSELSECLEGLRHGNPADDMVPTFSSAEVELADLVIRLMDMSAARGFMIAEAILAKMAFNEGRPHKHGKCF